jgi:hypothetical protein
MPLPQVVIDTNVIVAGLRSRHGSAFRLLALIDTGQFDIRDFAGVEQFGLNLMEPSEFLRLIGKLP